MELQEIKLAADKCIQEEPVYCKTACPLKLSIRDILEKLQNDNFDGAYRIYEKQSVFPEIVSHVCREPCKLACIRSSIDEGVNILGLEASLCLYGNKGIRKNYLIPPKKNMPGIHIIGGGLCGASCAFMLAEKGYKVSLYEKGSLLGGKLRNLSRIGLTAEILDKAFERVTGDAGISIFFNTEIDSLEVFGEDIIIVTTGDDGNTFSLFSDSDKHFDPVSLQSVKENVFVGGGLILGEEYNSVEDISCAKRIVATIERYIKKASLTLSREGEGNEETKLVTDLKGVSVQSAINPAKEGYLREQAVKEASRCLLCDCRICVKACSFLEYYKEYPRKYVMETFQSLNVIEKLSENISKRQINSCNLCGLCGVLCPTGLDMGEVYLAARRILHKKGEMPPVFYDFFIQDMIFSNEEAYVLKKNSNGRKTRYLFFPGCQLGASLPETLKKTYAFLLRSFGEEIAINLQCCGAPAYWAGDEDLHKSVIQKIRENWEALGNPIFILACPTCHKLFQKFLPEISCRSLWEILLEAGLSPKTGDPKGTFAIFDPCASRSDPAGQNSVRQLLKNWGAEFEELHFHGSETQCCGYGGAVKYTNPDLTEVIASKRNSLSDLEYITYCVNCRDTFLSGGKATRHILEYFFGKENEQQKLPSLSERRDNRRKLKGYFIGEDEKTIGEREMEERICVLISGELVKKMDRLRLLSEDIEKVIGFCEKTNQRLRIPGQEGFTGHLKQGNTTIWVSYKQLGSVYELDNVYCHRMALESESEPEQIL